jgi:hypothetical protein
MTTVHAVKSADGNHTFLKVRQRLQMLMHLHVCEGILLLFTARILKLSVNPVAWVSFAALFY